MTTPSCQSAYVSASKYADRGYHWLQKTSAWDAHYATALELSTAASEYFLFSGNFDRAEECSLVSIANASGFGDSIRARVNRICIEVSKGNIISATSAALGILEQLGFPGRQNGILLPNPRKHAP